MKRFAIAAILALAAPVAAEPVVRKIWDQAPHNAFTDLVRYQGQWYCTFREGAQHVSPDGRLRVIRSSDGVNWTSAALLTSSTADLRDPKFAIHPDGRLMINAAGALHKPDPYTHQTYVWFSRDGTTWSEPNPIGDPGYWLWRITWSGDTAPGSTAWSVGYKKADTQTTRLYSSRDGVKFQAMAPEFLSANFPNESTIRFAPDGQALCLVRHEAGSQAALLGSAAKPYRNWTWKDLGVRLGGPNFVRVPDGRWVAGGRLHDGRRRTALAWLDVEGGRLTEFLTLPSDGDSSYPGFVWHEGRLWVSYYSTHEGKSSIYLAVVPLPE